MKKNVLLHLDEETLEIALQFAESHGISLSDYVELLIEESVTVRRSNELWIKGTIARMQAREILKDMDHYDEEQDEYGPI
ncbi:MAG: hypothetical protein K9L66_00225 [Spirochaetaceae bacterium]|nr:hypothetical protein [Spirochaetaceae bacterium]MCF7947171.1 hypothetical protein [Spirochaetia bacterium]MCF7950036.1 hypothetical protein [Spirochaetaceae bacterium]